MIRGPVQLLSPVVSAITLLRAGPAFFYAFAGTCPITAEENDERLAKGIQDNSFFIEEAYNQEPGVVQHIVNIAHDVTRRAGPDDQRWSFIFTQEWPLGSQTHQFSYTVPYSFIETAGQSHDGVEDLLINYRFQALTETSKGPAFAPRFSLILPTGDEARNLGDGVVGYQFNLPASKIVSDRWTLHANAGLGGSAICAVDRRLNLMLECVANFDEDPDDDRASSVILSPGLRYAFNFKNHAQMVVGLAAPIGLTADAPDYGVFFIFHSNISLRAERKAGCNWIERSFCCRGAWAGRLFICSRRLIQAPLDLFS